MKELRKNILVAVTGLTPQIVTESLFSLYFGKKIIVDEIYVVTTARGKSVILGEDADSYTPDVPLKNEIENMCADYKFRVPLFDTEKNVIVAKEESLELNDIRNDDDNKLFPNRLSEVIKELTKDRTTVLYCCVSGGRKTMSVHLALVMSLFGRENDKLFHVLTEEIFERGDFYPKTPGAIASLVFSEIPFIRMRTLIDPDLESSLILSKPYSELVDFAQKKLKEISEKPKIVIDLRNTKVSYKNTVVELTKLEFAIYYVIIERKLNNKPNINANEMETLSGTIQDFFEEFHSKYFLKNYSSGAKGKYNLDIDSFRSKRTKINQKLKVLNKVEGTINFTIQSLRKYYDSEYYVDIDRNIIEIV